MRLTGNYQLASDIMQESFARYLEHYDPQTQNVSLLFTIARNLVWDNTRKKTNNKEIENDIDDVTINPEEQLLVRESYRNVLSAMQQLKKVKETSSLWRLAVIFHTGKLQIYWE